MPTKHQIPLCEHPVDGVFVTRYAVLDELTLTYDVVERGPAGPARTLARCVPTLREARTFARVTPPAPAPGR